MQTGLEAPEMEPRIVVGADAVRLEQVVRSYESPRGPVPALDGLILRVGRGEVVLICEHRARSYSVSGACSDFLVIRQHTIAFI